MRFDPTPDGVTLYRVNAIGFGLSLIAMFGAMAWWMAPALAAAGGGSFFIGFFGAIGLFTAAFYILPSLVPRQPWGYVVAWIQIALSLTSGTATLPTILVLIAFARGEVRDWFDRKPIDARTQAPSATRAKLVALIGYYLVVSAIPFGIVAMAGPIGHSDTQAATEAVRSGNVQVEVARGDLQTEALSPAEDFEATRLVSGEPWKLSEQGEPVAVTVWASYCSACSSQFRAIANAPSAPGTTTKYVTVALDCEKNATQARQKLAASDVESEALCVVDGIDARVLPTTIFFDANGVRRATLEGYHSAQALDDMAHAVESVTQR